LNLTEKFGAKINYDIVGVHLDIKYKFYKMASLVQNNNEHSLTSPEQKCTGEFGALAGDKSPSLPGTTNRGLWKV
jgi:hypothetical protein